MEIMVSKLCSQIETNVREHMQRLRWLSITVDGWTSRGMDSYVMVTGHWLDENFQVRQCALNVRPLRTAHNSQTLRAEVMINEHLYVDIFVC